MVAKPIVLKWKFNHYLSVVAQCKRPHLIQNVVLRDLTESVTPLELTCEPASATRHLRRDGDEG